MSNHRSEINLYSQAYYKVAVPIVHSHKYTPEEDVLINVHPSHQVDLVSTVKNNREKIGESPVNCEIRTCVVSNTQLSRYGFLCVNHRSLGYVSYGRAVLRPGSLVFVNEEDNHLVCGEVLYIGVHLLDYTNMHARCKVGVVKVAAHQLFYFVNHVGVVCPHVDDYGDDVFPDGAV